MDNLYKDALFLILTKVDFLSVCRLKRCNKKINKILNSKTYWNYRIRHEIPDNEKLIYPDHITPQEKYICALTQIGKCIYGNERYLYLNLKSYGRMAYLLINQSIYNNDIKLTFYLIDKMKSFALFKNIFGLEIVFQNKILYDRLLEHVKDEKDIEMLTHRLKLITLCLNGKYSEYLQLLKDNNSEVAHSIFILGKQNKLEIYEDVTNIIGNFYIYMFVGGLFKGEHYESIENIPDSYIKRNLKNSYINEIAIINNNDKILLKPYDDNLLRYGGLSVIKRFIYYINNNHIDHAKQMILNFQSTTKYDTYTPKNFIRICLKFHRWEMVDYIMKIKKFNQKQLDQIFQSMIRYNNMKAIIYFVNNVTYSLRFILAGIIYCTLDTLKYIFNKWTSNINGDIIDILKYCKKHGKIHIFMYLFNSFNLIDTFNLYNDITKTLDRVKFISKDSNLIELNQEWAKHNYSF